MEDDIEAINQILFKRPPAVCILGITTFLSEQQTWVSKAVIASPIDIIGKIFPGTYR